MQKPLKLSKSSDEATATGHPFRSMQQKKGAYFLLSRHSTGRAKKLRAG